MPSVVLPCSIAVVITTVCPKSHISLKASFIVQLLICQKVQTSAKSVH